MKHIQKINDDYILTISNKFIFFFGILVVNFYTEDRQCSEFKTTVKIKFFGKTIMHWHYRDRYLRDFYVNNKIIENYKEY